MESWKAWWRFSESRRRSIPRSLRRRLGSVSTPIFVRFFSAPMSLYMSTNGHVTYTPIRQMLSRRGFFNQVGTGLGGIALSTLLSEAVASERKAQFDVLPKKPHF